MLQGSPNLSSSAPPVSRRALKFFRLSPMRLPIPPRPHDIKGSTKPASPCRTFKSLASASFATRALLKTKELLLSCVPPTLWV